MSVMPKLKLQLVNLCWFLAVCVTPHPGYSATIVIVDMQDIQLGTVTPTANLLRHRARFCVAMRPRGPYQIIGLGTGTNGNFALTGGEGVASDIPMDVFISNRPQRRGRTLHPNIPLSGFRAQRLRPDGECRGRRTFITVQIDPSDLAAATAGQYSGSLYLTVAPQ